VTDQNNPSFGQAPQQPPPAAPVPAQQTFGDAPAPPAAPGEATFGAAPSAVPPAGEAFGAAPAPVKKKGGVVKIVGIVVAVLIVICLAGVGYLVKDALFGDKTKSAQAGDCIGNVPAVTAGQDKQADNAVVVACTDVSAKYKVLGRVEGKTEAEATDESVCAAYPETDSWFRAIASGGKGYVLCLSEVKK
jgi:hypothetical protein